MKTLILLLISLQALAFPNLQEANQFISQQLEINDSELNKKISNLKNTVKLPGITVFQTQDPGLVFEKPVQNYEDCVNEKCRIYQRKIYSKISSFRTDYIVNRNHSIWIQWIEIVVSYRKTFDKDSKELIQDQFVVEGVYFL